MKELSTRVNKPNKVRCMFNGLRMVVSHRPFLLWLIICTVGIAAGLLVGVGMTVLTILVAVACIGLALEAGNTAIERLLDLVKPEYSEGVKIIKDITGVMPILVYSAYVICWLILVSPLVLKAVINVFC